MSRIGKLPIAVPAGVDVKIDGSNVAVKGKNGELKESFDSRINIEQQGDTIIITRTSEQKEVRALHGLTRSLLQNMVTGVSEGFSKKLEIVGVGYRAQLQGKKLVLALGYSHPVEMEAPEGITFEVPDQNTILVKGYNKQVVGQVAANIRKYRKPEPYKGKGIKYEGEYIRRKVGKTGM
ncbi:MAG: 50S ribosomal protein L6 [Christensenellaceae bacterium]|jgi:large subunit ribosomal protein L6